MPLHLLKPGRGIARYGLTVGDVPTDLAAFQGRCGVWLTSDMTARGHGLERSAHDKSQFRLTVAAPDNRLLVRWVDWAPAPANMRTADDLASLDQKLDGSVRDNPAGL